jgi:hypothetical protein
MPNYTPRKCSCGSGENRTAVYDARNIFLAYTCSKCRKNKLSKFRPEVLTNPNYTTNEPIEED